MAEQVRIDITAEDKASKPLDAVADKVETIEDVKPKVTVEADTKAADRDIKAVLDKAETLGDVKPKVTVEADTKAADRNIKAVLDKAEQLADAPAELLLKSNAASVQADIKKLVGDIDKLDAEDPEISVKVDQINALQGDLDQLENKLQSIDKVEVSPKIDTDRIRRAGDDAGHVAEGIQSGIGPLRGFTDELGGGATAAGTYANAIIDGGEAIQVFGSQLGFSEEALGKVSKAMGIAGLAVGGAGLLWSVFSKELAKSKKAQEDNAKQVDVLFKSLQDGKSILDSFNKSVQETGKFEFPGLGDILPEMNHLNITVEEFNRLAGLSPDQLEAWASKQKALLNEGKGGYEGLRDVVFAVTNAHQNAITAEERHAITAAALDSINRDAAANAKQLNAAYRDAADASTAYTDAQAAGADMLARVNGLLADQAAALQEQADAATAAADSHIGLTDAQRQAAEATQATVAAALAAAEATKQHGAASSEAAEAQKTLDEAIRSERDAAISASQAAVQYAADQAKAAGANQTATQKIDTANAALLEQATKATPAAQQAIADYIFEANQVPPDKQTDIRAMIARGDFDVAAEALRVVSLPRTAAVNAEAHTAAAEDDLGPNGLTRPRTVDITARVREGSFPGSGQANAPMPSAALAPAGSDATLVTINVPRGTRPDDVMAAADRYARRNGRSHALRR